MALDLVAIRPIPLLVGALASMIIGAAWYAAFAKPWTRMAHPGKTEKDLQAGPKWPYAVATVSGVVLAYVFGVLSAAAGRDLATSLGLATLLSAALVLAYLTTYAFSYRPLALALIDAGYYVASIFAIALLYALL